MVSLLSTGRVLKPASSSQDSIPFYSKFRNFRFLKNSLEIVNSEEIFLQWQRTRWSCSTYTKVGARTSI